MKLQVQVDTKKYKKLKQTLKDRGQTISGWLRVLIEKTISGGKN